MAHLLILNDDPREWTPVPVVGAAMTFVNGTLRPVDETPPIGLAQTRLVLRRLVDGSHTWDLLTSFALRLNGAPVPLGIALLDDRDEIRRPDLMVWYSTETQALIEPLPESTTRRFCPRCKQPIEVATPAVRCPSYGLWHHASDDLPCWSYTTVCAACAQDTALDADFRWTTEDL